MKKKIVIDPGHGGIDPGAVANGLLEKNLNLSICLKLAQNLSAYEAEIILTRDSDTAVALMERADIANRAGADFFLSIHCNAGGGEGFESYTHTEAPAFTLNMREIIHREVALFCRERNIADRGMKAANFAVLRLTAMPAVLLEMLFVDNSREAELLQNEVFLRGLAAAVTRGAAAAVGLSLKQDQGGSGEMTTPAKVTSEVRPAQAKAYLREKNPQAPDYVDTYASLEHRYGIRWDAVFAQSCRETGFWKFGGLVKPEQNNFCGLGSFGGNPGASFPTPGEGIEAQFQHWHAYYYGGDLPPGTTALDPRRDAVLKSGWAGSLVYLEDLGGHWSPNREYGIIIVRDYLGPMKSTVAPDPPPPAWDPQLEIEKLKKAGLIVSDHSPGDFVTWGELATVLNKILK